MIRAQLMKSDLQLSALAVSTTTSARWDLSGCDYAVLDVYLNKQVNTSTGAITLSVTEADTTTLSTVTVVANASVTPGSTGQLHRYLIDTRTRKRYLFLKTDPTDSTNDTVSIQAVLHKFRNVVDPDAAADMVATTNDSVTTVG